MSVTDLRRRARDEIESAEVDLAEASEDLAVATNKDMPICERLRASGSASAFFASAHRKFACARALLEAASLAEGKS